MSAGCSPREFQTADAKLAQRAATVRASIPLNLKEDNNRKVYIDKRNLYSAPQNTVLSFLRTRVQETKE
jgi:hypothetical protein